MIRAATLPAGSIRLHGLDRLRGAAIAAMICSHVLATFPTVPGNALRLTVLRFVAPIFVVVAGSLLASRTASFRTFSRLSVASVATFAVSFVLGEFPPILLQFLMLLAVWPLVLKAPKLAALIAVTWAMNAAVFPVPATWYQPGAMVLAALIGRSIGRDRLADFGRALPSWLGFVGRYPLTFYVGHLAFLGALVAAGIGSEW